MSLDEINGNKRKREEKEEIVPLHLRPRKLDFWDLRPDGYENMTADQIKATGSFLLPMHLLKGTGRVEPVQALTFGYAPVVVEKKVGYNTKRLVFHNLPQCDDEEFIAWINMTFEEEKWKKKPGLSALACFVDPAKNSAIVEFRSTNECSSALQFQGMLFKEKEVKVARPKDYQAGDEDPNYIPGVIGSIVADTPNKLFIGGIPTYVTQDQVIELFKEFGVLKSFLLARDPSNSISKGFAFCEYLDPEVTDIACEGLHGLELGDKKLIVQRANTTATRVAVMEGALPGIGLGRPILPIEILGANGLKPAEPTEVLLMINVLDPKMIEKDSDFEEIELDIKLELERFGTVEVLTIPRPVEGEVVPGLGRVYCKFASIEECQKAQRALAGRRYEERTVCTTFLDPYKFEAKVF